MTPNISQTGDNYRGALQRDDKKGQTVSYERAAEIAGNAAYTSAGGTVIAGLTLHDWAVVVGIIATIITAGLNWYYKQQHLKIARRNAGMTGDDD